MQHPARISVAVIACGAFLGACNLLWGIDAPTAVPEGGSDATLDRASSADARGDDGRLDSGVEAADTGEHDAHARDAGTESAAFDGHCPEGSPPVILASGEERPANIAADSRGVYWSSDQDFWVLRFGSPPASANHVDSGVVSEGVAVSPLGTVVWGQNSTIYECSDPPCTPKPLAAGPSFVEFVAADTTSVYWNTMVGELLECPLVGCKTPAGMTVPFPNGLAADDAYVYWSDGASTIYSCAASGCGVGGNTVVTGESSPTHLALHDGTLYWSESVAGLIRSCPLAAGTCAVPPGTIVTTNLPYELAADDANVYWVDGSSSLNRAPVGGSSEGGTRLYGSASGSLALGESCVFWTDEVSAVRAGPK